MNKKLLLIPVILLLLVGSVLGVGTMPNNADVVAYWSFDDVDYSSPTLFDLTANNNDGTNHGAVSGATGIFNQAFTFDGTNDYINFGNIGVNGADSRTYNVWVKLTSSIPENSIHVLLGQRVDGTDGASILFTLRDVAGTEYVYFTIDGAFKQWLVDDIDNGNWHFLSVTFDGTTMNDFELYYDGSLLSTSSTDGLPDLVNTVNNNLYIGKSPDDVYDLFGGLSDEVSVFDVAFTLQNHIFMYNEGIPSINQQYLFSAVHSNFDITNTNGLNNFTAYFNSTSYSTTNGTINTGIESTETFNIIIESNEGYYFNNTYTNYNISADLSTTFIEYPRVTIYNNFSLEILSNFNISYDTITINDVSGVAYLFLNETKNITINKVDYFSKTLSHNFTNSNDLNISLYQSIINVNITEMFSGNPISNWTLWNSSTLLINTTSNVGTFYPVAGEFNNLVLKSNQGVFSNRNIDGFNVSLGDNKTFYYELLPTEMNVTAKNILTDVSISNFSVSYSSLNNSHSGSYSTTSGELIFGVINGDTYNITIDADDYALYDNNILKLISGNSNHTFSLYTDNSINFEVRWEENNTLITDNVTILLTGAITTYTYNTVDGSYYADNIIDDTYSIKSSVSGLDDKYYSITVNDRSHQDLTIYFANNYENVTFLFQDKVTGTSLAGVYFSMSRYINNSLVVVSSKLSDITGTVTAKYVSGTFYQISGLKTGYSEKTFELNPIESDLYIVKMESASSQIFIDDGVSVYYTPKSFVAGMNNFSFTINSPLGLLTNYWFNVSYPNNHNNYSGTESIGEIFDFNFNITNPSLYDNVKVEFYYITSFNDETHLTFYHPINYINASASAWSNLKEGYKDLGIFERIIIVVLCVIIISGFGYLIGGVGGSLISGLLIYVFFVATGFIPLWSILISLLVGFVLVLRGGSFG